MWGYTAVFPLISALVWLGMLLGLFINWEASGHPIYPSMEAGQTIAYISDTGAYRLKPLFIAGSAVTTVFLDLGFLSERWLRHTGRLAQNTSFTQKVLSMLSIVFAIAGTCGLILLSIFDTYRHPNMHDGFLVLFLGGYIVSAIFLCAEYQRLGIHYRNHRILRISFWLKLFFILVEVCLAIVFGVTSYKHHRNIAAVFEWTIALIFTLYVLSFILDLLPSVHSKHHLPQGLRQEEFEKGLRNGDVNDHTLTSDSAGPNQEMGGAEGYRGTTVPANGYPNGQTNLGGRPKRGFGRLHF